MVIGIWKWLTLGTGRVELTRNRKKILGIMFCILIEVVARKNMNTYDEEYL